MIGDTPEGNRQILDHHTQEPDPYLSLADPFDVVYRLQVLGLECWQFEMDISSAHPGGCRGQYMLTASFPLLCKNEQCVSAPLV